jgi:hypothetical protein
MCGIVPSIALTIGEHILVSAMHIIERAYQLARSGKCANFAEIRLRLKSERFASREILDYFAGRAIRDDLANLCEKATGQPRRRPPAKNGTSLV